MALFWDDELAADRFNLEAIAVLSDSVGPIIPSTSPSDESNNLVPSHRVAARKLADGGAPSLLIDHASTGHTQHTCSLPESARAAILTCTHCPQIKYIVG